MKIRLLVLLTLLIYQMPRVGNADVNLSQLRDECLAHTTLLYKQFLPIQRLGQSINHVFFPNLSFRDYLLTVRSILFDEINLTPIECTKYRNFAAVGLLTSKDVAGDNEGRCVFSYLGDNLAVTAAHCLFDTETDKFLVPHLAELSRNSLAADQGPVAGCEMTMYCVPDNFPRSSDSNSRERDIGFVRLSGCDFSQTSEPFPIGLRAFSAQKWHEGNPMRLVGYLLEPGASFPKEFTTPEVLIWTGSHRTSNLQMSADGRGLLCHQNSTLPGTSGALLSSDDLQTVSCIHTIPENGSHCPPVTNACTIVTDIDVAAFASLRAGAEPAGFLCNDY